MDDTASLNRNRGQRIRSALLVFSALILFLFGLFLLFAPAPASNKRSRKQPGSFHVPLKRVDNGTAIAKADFAGREYFCSG
jgi:hypothetical protein